MAIYVHKFGGYIADVANIDFKRCDGTVYSCNTATATNMSATANSLSITGGQGQYPIGFIDTDRGLECSFTNAMFDGDMFEIANATNAVDGDSSTFETAKLAVETGLKIEMPFEVEAESVYIRGLENGAATAAGTFKVEVAEGKTTITFAEGDVAAADEVNVSYNRRIANAHDIIVNTNTASSKGSVWMHWPVYSSGTDCTEAAIKGWVHVHVYRVRVTALPAIDSSYKTAATHSMTFTAIDPQRADKKMYRITYEPLSADGSYDVNYGDAVVYQ
jgi:hypothetical protein